MMTRSILSIALVGVLTTATLADDAKPPKTLMPLKLGNSWTYSATMTPKGEGEAQTAEITNEVIAVRRFKSDKGKVSTWFHVREFDDFYWERNTKKGLMDAAVEYNENEFAEDVKLGQTWSTPPVVTSDQLWLKYHTTVGDKWKIVDELDGTEVSTLETISVNTKVEVPAGTFTCIHYREKSEGVVANYFVTPGIGYIKFEKTDEEEGTTVYLLKSYKAK